MKKIGILTTIIVLGAVVGFMTYGRSMGVAWGEIVAELLFAALAVFACFVVFVVFVDTLNKRED